MAKIGENFSIQLIISKLGSDGESMVFFRMMDYEEIVPYSKLEKKINKIL